MRFLTTSNWPSRRMNSWDLFDEMERLFTEMNQTPSRSSFERSFTPACDVEEAEDHFLMTVDLPGIKKEDIKIEMQENVLTISGERQRVQKSSETDRAQRFERTYGSFSRSFTLPATVAGDKIEAQYEDGVLNLYLPKTPVAKARKIEIQSSTKEGGFFNRILASKKESDSKSSTTPH